MSIKYLIPNSLSLANLACGCAAAMYAINGELFLAAILIVIAAVFDLLDGMMARLLKATSDIGEQLDSLADMVTFGVAPGMMVFSILSNVDGDAGWLPFAAFIIPLCSALRLARFNAIKAESESFIGLPTPANAIFWAMLIIISHWKDQNLPPSSDIGFHFDTMMADQSFVLTVAIILALLMVSKIPMFSLKLKNLSWQNNKVQYIFLVCCVLSIISFQAVGLLLIIPLYILLSVIIYLFIKKNNEIQS